MPRASGLGDHASTRPTARQVTITVEDAPPTDARRATLVARALTFGTCLLLVGAGIGVGLWAAM